MPYVQRNALGLIDSLHRHPQPEASEHLPDDHPQVQEFVGRPSVPAAFDRLDADFVRVIEDVIDTLLAKNLLAITDLPAEAQAKLFARRSFRERTSHHALNLFGDEAGFLELVKDTGFSKR